MRPITHRPPSRNSAMRNYYQLTHLLVIFWILISSAYSMARSIDQGEGCLWETEDAPTFFPKKNKNSIHADASPNILMDVFPADTTICAGQSVQFSVSGIDPSFSYEWSATDGSFDDIHSPTPTYTILTAGTYAVIVIISDQNNNNIGFFNTSVTVSPPITVAINTSGEDCGQLGSINLTLSGGSGNFTIDWEDLAGTNDMEDRNNLTAGTYTVNVSDDNGCLQTNNIVVPLLCNNACAANAGTITPDEGFLCVPGSFATISATPDGNMTVPSGFAVAYFLTKGANSLIVQTSGNPSFIVTTSGAYTIHTFVYDPATFDINSIILDTTTLNEVNTQLMQGGGGICGALDTNGATTLTEKAVGFVVTSTPETCDAEDGQVILAPVSNSFLWEDGFMGNERNDLANGNYSITVSQTSGCTGEINVTVDEVCQCPVPPTVNNIVVFEATCGNANGSATIEMIGNNNDYTYQWQPNVSTSNVATNLPSGSYSVLITNANDATCFAVENFVIGNSDGPDVQILSTSPANCTAANGEANLMPTTLDYTWCDGGNGFFRNDLLAGTCAVTVTDPTTGCTNVIEVTIDEINNLTTQTAVANQPNCGAADGVASILVSGGSGNYTFVWNDGGENATRFGLSAGTYVVTVTDDSDGCTAIQTFTLTNVTAAAFITGVSDIALNCSGDSDGQVNYSVQFSGGFAPPANEVIRDAAGNTFTNGNLTAGNYCVLVYDGNGCLAGQECFEVTEPNPLTLNISPTNQTCSQMGAIHVLTTGGNGAYIYNWQDVAGNNNPADRTGLMEGTYFLEVTDGNGCAVSASVQVGNDCSGQACLANAGTLVIDANPVCLVLGNATVSATPQGNSVVPNGFITTYLLASGGVIQVMGNTPVFSVSTASSYTIHALVHDVNTLPLSAITPNVTTIQMVNDMLEQGGGMICGALDMTGATVSVMTCGGMCTTPPQILNIVKIASSCGQSTGSAIVNMVGDNNDYTFSFSMGNGNANSVSDLASGTYEVTITDTNDPTCVLVESFSITNANGPQATVIATSPTSCAANNGSAQLSPATFDYAWCDGGTGAVRNDLFSGVCAVTVTDPATGCTNILEVETAAQNLLQITPLINQNPDCGMSNGVVVLQIGGGSNNYTFEWSDPNSIDNAIRNDLPGGTFGVTVTDNGPNGCVGTATFTLVENVASMATVNILSVSTVSCPGDANGMVNYNLSLDAGFVQPVTERIKDAAGNVYLNGTLPAGDYCVEVTDGNGCVAGNDCFSINDPDPIHIDIAAFPTSCSQGGTINLTATGGSGTYSYDWGDLGGNNDPQNRIDLSVGVYSVTVTDNNSCTASMTNIIITDGCTNCQATSGALQADSTNICFNGLPLTITATETVAPVVPAGFNVIYVLTMGVGFDILQMNSIPDFSVNALGNYMIHTLVFDGNTLNPNDYANGIDLNAALLQGGGTICGAFGNGAPITLMNCLPCINPQIQNVITIASSCGNAEGGATVNMAGNGNYTFQWSAGTSTTNSNFGLAAGTYTFTVTDTTNPNCTTVDSLIIANTDGPDMSIFSQTPTSCNANNGTAVLQPQTNLFDWSDGVSGAIRNDLAAGVNFVTVTDPATNCSNVYEVFIESVQSLDIMVNVTQQPDCQVANGELNLTVTGGSTNYTYVWSDNANIDSPNRTGLAGGTYAVTVIDNGPNACEESITFVLLENALAGATISISNPNNEVLVSCTGNADGNVQYTVATAPGFVMPATETIYDGNGNAQTNGQLAPGDYCVVVTDGNGCVTGQSCFEVIDPEPIEVNVQVTHATCTDPGGITIFAFGGTGFLIFDWADLPNSSDPQNRFNLTAGLYSLTVSDGNGCSVAVNDILVQDGCISDCPTSSEESLILPINTTDSFCVSLDTCFDATMTTYTLLDGGMTGSSIYGTWELNDSCLVYTANDTAGVFIDTICVLANFNVLTDTTCIIVTVLPECGGADIIMEDSITLVTDDCVAGADYCLEIELAQILNFSLTDNGQPYTIAGQGCNFDTTYFYSLAAFLNIAPNGPYTLTSWNVNNSTFTIDTFQTIPQLVDSMNVWDAAGNWMLDGSIITGGATNSMYGSLNIIQFVTGASTNLDVDINQIPNGTVLTLDTGYHELIIVDLVTGCKDTLYADVICDDCADFYSGPSTIVGSDCNALTDLCLDIPFQEFLFNFEITDNGSAYAGVKKGCGFDTLSTCYLISALPDQGAVGPYSIDLWEVGGVTFASTFDNLQELLALMNGWDATGNWTLDAVAGTICGGTPGQTYGMMNVTQTTTGATAMLDPDYVIQTFASAIELDTGFHQIILVDTVSGCTDTLDITVDCDVVTGGVDTILQVMVSTTDTFCFNLTDTIVSATNLCPDLSDGNVAGFGFIPNTNCIEYTGSVIGLDTFCMVFGYPDGSFDTTGIVIEVVPQLLTGDTIPIGVLVNFTETFCIDTSVFLAPLDTIYNYCENSSGTYADVSIIEPNCIEVMGFNIGQLDTACIVICDTTGFCDTTIFLIEVTRPELITVYDTIKIMTSDTYCPDTTQLFGTVVSIENICDTLSGTNVDFVLDSMTFCVNYTGLLLGTDTACLVVCDDLGICDTTNFIVTVINPIDTIIAVDDDTLTITTQPVTIDIFGNDTFDPDSLIFGIITGVSHGTLVSNPDGSFTYLATAGFCGDIDTFTYFISNGTISDTATVTIEVLCKDIKVYNGFSPNNDGIHETLVIEGIGNYSNNVVRIYNRWGNLVYEKKKYKNDDGWDGKFEGKDLPDGTYFYVIDDGEGHKYNGWLQIRR